MDCPSRTSSVKLGVTPWKHYTCFFCNTPSVIPMDGTASEHALLPVKLVDMKMRGCGWGGPQDCSQGQGLGWDGHMRLPPLTSVSSRVPAPRCHQQSCPTSHRTDRFMTVNEIICPRQEAHTSKTSRAIDFLLDASPRQ